MNFAFRSNVVSLRRGLLAAAAAATALAASGGAVAQTKTLYIGMNGGTMDAVRVPGV